VLDITVSSSSAASSIPFTTFNTIEVGRTQDGSSPDWFGNISNYRFVKGTAVYTSNFTPPTAPLTAITNTSLLTCQSNRFIDNSPNNFAITVSGNTAINPTNPFTVPSSVAVNNFYSTSFDGAGDYLTTTLTNLNYAFGTGDFTIEFWLYVNVLPTNPASAQLFDTRPASTNGAYPLIYLENDGTIRLWVSSANRITSLAISTITWYHVAVCRSSGSTKMFINGTQAGSTYTDSTSYLAGNALIGASYSGGPTISNYLNSKDGQELNNHLMKARKTH
jgi:hypothetical protein